MNTDWYENRRYLSPGDVFSLTYGENRFVKLEGRVPGDGTDWYVLDWVQKMSGGYWTDNGSKIHPSDLKERAVYVGGWYKGSSKATQEGSSMEAREEAV